MTDQQHHPATQIKRRTFFGKSISGILGGLTFGGLFTGFIRPSKKSNRPSSPTTRVRIHHDAIARRTKDGQ